jgi:hypothetical protein
MVPALGALAVLLIFAALFKPRVATARMTEPLTA